MKVTSIASLLLSGCVLTGCVSHTEINVEQFAAVGEQKQLERSVLEVVRKVTPASVSVTAGQGGFSAVIVSPEGYALSAGHAVKPGTKYTVTLADGREFKAVGLGSEPTIDMGLLKISEPDNLPVAEMGWSATVKSGQPVISISHPGGGDQERGTVVRLGYIADVVASNGMIRSTCLMEPGDSGGPLFDMEGRVIAVHSQIAASLDDNKEVGVDNFRRFWDQMVKAESFKPSDVYQGQDYGFEFEATSTARKQRSGRPNSNRGQRVDVTSVEESSPVAAAGLKVGDRFESINGERARTYVEVTMLLENAYTLQQSHADVVVERDGEEVSIKLPLPENTAAYNAWSGDVQILQSEPLSRPVNPVAGIDEILEPVAVLEDLLDDNTVEVSSEKNDTSTAALATIIKRDSWFSFSTLLVSKSSLVGENVAIEYQDQTLPAEVVSRDDANDLVLLKVNRKLKGGISLEDMETAPAERGEFLMSPHPKYSGRFGVWGSKVFTADKRESGGFLGVFMEESEGKILLNQISEDGPAKDFFKAGDFIVKVNGKAVTKPKELAKELSSYEPGDMVKMEAVRDGETFSVELALGVRPDNGKHIAETFRGGKSLRRDGFEKVFSHDARLRPDECGGPVYSIDGEFLGINIARHSRTRSYALPAEVVAEFVKGAQAE
ncbi:trypsin-like peptidase domain-containing protein [Porticoccaceae bacterium LTM1]|nr:trypsin-like peptidase domain-containing protein [Porticoccaceae bacterium LTM1]